FARKYAASFHKPVPILTDEAIASLMAHDWPGNVRELENVVQEILATRGGKTVIDEVDLPMAAGFNRMQEQQQSEDGNLLKAAIARFEHQFLARLVEKYEGNLTEVAHFLGVSLSTVSFKCRKYRIPHERGAARRLAKADSN